MPALDELPVWFTADNLICHGLGGKRKTGTKRSTEQHQRTSKSCPTYPIPTSPHPPKALFCQVLQKKKMPFPSFSSGHASDSFPRAALPDGVSPDAL